jgi:outer membrane lipoprotein SlyB
MSKRITAIALLALVAACGMRKPVVFKDDHYQEVGEAQVQQDVSDCMEVAKSEVGAGSGELGQTATRTATGTVVGGAAGAAGGAIWGNPGRGAASGAVAGFVGGLLSSLFGKKEPDPVYKGYVDRCLRQRGYDVAGWR